MGHLNVRLVELADEIQSCERIDDPKSLRTDLIKMLREVVEDLDRDRVNHEEFEYFSFTWRAVNDIVSSQMTGLRLRKAES